MGWYAWVPLHGVLPRRRQPRPRAGRAASSIDGQAVDFTGGRGYTEKDWGRAFPAAYVWCQSNHFARPGTSLTASVAIIPWLRTAFPGFIVGLWHEGMLYRFATYTGARTGDACTIGRPARSTGRSATGVAGWQLRLARQTGGILRAPTTLTMDRRIVETLSATAEVRLEEAGSRPRVLFERADATAGSRPRATSLE